MLRTVNNLLLVGMFSVFLYAMLLIVAEPFFNPQYFAGPLAIVLPFAAILATGAVLVIWDLIKEIYYGKP